MRLGEQMRRGVFFLACDQGVTLQVWFGPLRYVGLTLWLQPRLKLVRVGSRRKRRPRP